MKKILAVLLAVALVCSLAVMASAEEAGVVTKVALVTDVGTIDDESFN